MGVKPVTSKDQKGKNELLTVDQMAAEMAVKKKKPRTEAGIAREEALVSDIANTRAALQRAFKRQKVDLADLIEVAARIDNYFQACEESATYPSWIGLCTKGLGVSTTAVQAYIARHPTAESVKHIIQAREMIADILINQSLAGNASPVPSIFQLKNWYGHKDKVEVAAMAVEDEKLTADDVRKKYAIVAEYKVVEDSREDSQEDSPT